MAKDSQRDSSADDERELPDEPVVDDEIEDDEPSGQDDEADVEDDDSDDVDSDGDDDDDDDADEDDDEVASRGKKKSSATATKKKPTRSQRTPKPVRAAVPGSAPGTFVQQSISELQKAVWPTKKQMVTYTTVVMIFVVLLVGAIWGFDLGIGKVMDWVFA